MVDTRDESIVYANGQSVHVFFDYEKNKTDLIPKDFIEKISDYIEYESYSENLRLQTTRPRGMSSEWQNDTVFGSSAQTVFVLYAQARGFVRLSIPCSQKDLKKIL